MRRLLSRLRAMLLRVVDGDAPRDDLNEEIRSFLAHDIDSKVQTGMTPEEARRAALIDLGGTDQIKERVWESAAGARMESIVRDIRYAMRSLGQARAFSSSVIGSLSLGLATTIMTFALINGTLLPRPIPGVQDQDRLVMLGILESVIPGRWNLRRTAWTDYPDVVRALDGMTSLESVASFIESDVVSALPQPLSLPAAFVSPHYFDVLGVQTEIGRSFVPEEGGAESAVAIISHALWMRELGGDPSVVGRAIQVGRQPFQIIGVAPQGFAGTQTEVELWLPIIDANRLAMDDPFGQPGRIRYVGRVRDGVRVDRVETELGVVAGGIVASAAEPDSPDQPVRVEVSGLNESDAGDVLEVAMTLAVPLLILTIGCVNAANLLLVRATRRRREVAVRLALGASRLRLVRQLIIESLILAMAAALLGLALAWWGIQWLEASVVFTYPMSLDAKVLAAALVTAFLTALAFGLVPAFRATGQPPSAALGTAHAGSGGTRSQSRGRRVLVAGQVALSLGLLGTAFQLTSALETVAEPPATDPDRVLMASFDLEQLRFSSAESDAFYSALLDGASRLPGVEAAALSNRNLTDGWTDGPPVVPLRSPDMSFGRFVMSGFAVGDYFEVIGLDLVRGREFVETDRREIPEVAIVTERLAAQIFEDAGAAAIGRSVYVSAPFDDAAGEVVLRIVGVVESPGAPSGNEVAAIFFPSPVQQSAALTLHVRSEGPAAALVPAIRDLVGRLDAQVPILELTTLDRFDTENLDERMLASVVALLGIVAVLLASIGLYGVTSYSVAIRAREIAVRIALGARPGGVQSMVLRQALSTVLIGSVVGGLAAIGIGLLIRAEILDVAAVDVARLGGSAAVLALAMLVASLVPARRAARLDPYAVLREE